MKNRTWVLAPAVVLLCIAANTALLVPKIPGWWAVQVLCALATNLLPLSLPRQNGIRLWLLAYGNGCLKIFVVSTVFSVVMQILLGIYLSFFKAEHKIHPKAGCKPGMHTVCFTKQRLALGIISIGIVPHHRQKRQIRYTIVPKGQPDGRATLGGRQLKAAI